MNEVTGKIIQLGDVFINPAGTFTKQEIVLEIQAGEYSNVAVLEAIQDKVQELSAFVLGDEVKCTFYLNGQNKPWNDPKTLKDRYFNCLKIDNIKKVEAGIQESNLVAPPNVTPEVPPMAEAGEIPLMRLGDFEQ